MLRSTRNVVFSAGLVLAMYANVSLGQPRPFRFQPMRAGERVVQQVAFGMKLKVRASSDTSASTSNRNLERLQHRTVELLEPEGAAVPRAKVTFDRAEQRQNYSGGIETNLREPVVGQSYLIARRGDDLLVTDLEGQPVAPEEQAVVAVSMQAFGRPNPLSKFLAGKTVGVGETVKVSPDVAEQLFASWREVIVIESFELTLLEMQAEEAGRLAVFQTVIQGKSRGDQAHMALLQGQLAVDLDTCRIASAALSGPLRMSQSENVDGSQVKLECDGVIYARMSSLPDRGLQPAATVTTRPQTQTVR